MNTNQRTYLVGGIIALLVLVVGVGLSTSLIPTRPKDRISETPAIPKNGQTISATGTITCLQHINAEGPQTMECALGLKTDGGSYYALGGDSAVIMGLSTDQKIRITGTLSEPTKSIYKSNGTITVATVEKL